MALFHRLPESSTGAGGKQLPWAYLSGKRPHTHDVRAMCVAAGKQQTEGARLFTGSNDTLLFMYSVENYLKVGVVRGIEYWDGGDGSGSSCYNAVALLGARL